MLLKTENSLEEKLILLSDAAKYDVACTSSGANRKGDGRHMGNCIAPGICHSFSADGRCISLLKILMTNYCVFDCKYCLNRSSNDVRRAIFTPEEICMLTMEFYRRNYIEGLFLSSGIVESPTRTMELLCQTVRKLRLEYGFRGYIHLKTIPGAASDVIDEAGYYADRMSVNLEFPTADGLRKLAPHKTRQTILKPMRQIQLRHKQCREELMVYQHAKEFAPAGQSTQMIVGAAGEADYQIISVAESLYQKFGLKRVFYSAFVNVNKDETLLPACQEGPPLWREHRLYQADWLMRFYQFRADELLTEKHPDFHPFLDPKCDWAIAHLEEFPVEINRADYHTLLRVPGIGVKSALRIIKARKLGIIQFDDLKRFGVVLKRALYFVTCNGRMLYPVKMDEDYIVRNLLENEHKMPVSKYEVQYKQLSLF